MILLILQTKYPTSKIGWAKEQKIKCTCDSIDVWTSWWKRNTECMIANDYIQNNSSVVIVKLQSVFITGKKSSKSNKSVWTSSKYAIDTIYWLNVI